MTLTFDDVTFSYRSRGRPTLTGLNIAFQPGRTILLGPNGAGKSTLLAIGASVLPLRRGRGRVLLGDLASNSRADRALFRRRVAWMPQTVRPASGVTVRQQVALHAWLSGMAKADAWQGALDALVKVDLHALQDAKASNLSGGQRARMGLAQALVRSAEVLLLDEPTAALDPDQKDAFVGLLNAVGADRTIVVSSHDVSDLEESYDRVVVLAGGKVQYEGATDSFLRPADRDLSPVDAYRAALGGVR